MNRPCKVLFLMLAATFFVIGNAETANADRPHYFDPPVYYGYHPYAYGVYLVAPQRYYSWPNEASYSAYGYRPAYYRDHHNPYRYGYGYKYEVHYPNGTEYEYEYRNGHWKAEWDD